MEFPQEAVLVGFLRLQHLLHLAGIPDQVASAVSFILPQVSSIMRPFSSHLNKPLKGLYSRSAECGFVNLSNPTGGALRCAPK